MMNLLKEKKMIKLRAQRLRKKGKKEKKKKKEEGSGLKKCNCVDNLRISAIQSRGHLQSKHLYFQLLDKVYWKDSKL